MVSLAGRRVPLTQANQLAALPQQGLRPRSKACDHEAREYAAPLPKAKGPWRTDCAAQPVFFLRRKFSFSLRARFHGLARERCMWPGEMVAGGLREFVNRMQA